MKIEILRIDGLEVAAQGWRLSRNIDKPVDWRDIVTIDVPVNELPSCVLDMSGFTILEREIFTSSRSHVMWARTSHVDDPLKFEVPESLADRTTSFLDGKRLLMRAEKDAGASQDEWRRHLPIMSTTAWTMRISFRDLVKIRCYFDYLITQAVNESLAIRFIAVRDALGSIVLKFTGDEGAAQAAFASMQRVKFLHEGIVDPGGTVERGEFYVIGLVVPLWLRAQIVRHRPLQFVDSLFTQVIQSRRALDMTIDLSLRMQLATSKEYWRSIMSKRACWLAQDALKGGAKDAWQQILDQFDFDGAILPCSDGVCPYHGDAKLRVIGEDPGVPCPQFCEIAGVDKAPYRDAMLVAAESRHPAWRRRIER